MHFFKSKYGVVFSLVALTLSLFTSPQSAFTAKDEIKAEEFISSKAGRLFQKAEYRGALSEIDLLLKKYPNDSLLLRYRGIALDQLGNSNEAIQIFKKLLNQNDSHVPTHYFLAQAYFKSGQLDNAVQEWERVARDGEGTPYAKWSRASLDLAQARRTRGRAAQKLQPWHVLARYGYEYDSNVILRPNDGSVASSRDHNAGRQLFDLSVRYRAVAERDVAVDLLYATSQTIHDDSLEEFNFHSESFGIHARKRVQVRGRDVTAGFRYDVILGVLENNLFSVRNRWQLTADARLSDRTRTVFFERISIADFGPDGFAPATTSRDGLYNDVGLTHYIYTKSDFRDYFYFRQEFNSAHTRGSNFDKVGTTSRLGMHMAVNDRVDLDLSTGLLLGFYHNFSSVSAFDLSRRRNIDWDFYGSLTYRLTPNVGIRGFYRLVHARNQNNFFEYDRQIGGVQVIYSKSF